MPNSVEKRRERCAIYNLWVRSKFAAETRSSVSIHKPAITFCAVVLRLSIIPAAKACFGPGKKGPVHSLLNQRHHGNGGDTHSRRGASFWRMPKIESDLVVGK